MLEIIYSTDNNTQRANYNKIQHQHSLLFFCNSLDRKPVKPLPFFTFVQTDTAAAGTYRQTSLKRRGIKKHSSFTTVYSSSIRVSLTNARGARYTFSCAAAAVVDVQQQYYCWIMPKLKNMNGFYHTKYIQHARSKQNKGYANKARSSKAHNKIIHFELLYITCTRVHYLQDYCAVQAG